MRKFYTFTAFFITTPLVLLFALIFVLSLSYAHDANAQRKPQVAFAALPTNQNVFEQEIIQQDGRIEKVRQFLTKYNSPMEPDAEFIVAIADQYGLDYRLVPAIAMQESNLCKKIPHGSHNCWGFGIYGGKVTKFDSYKDGIEAVTKTLVTKYKQSGLVTPEEIMKRWTPSSNGSWAFSVNHFMEQL